MRVRNPRLEQSGTAQDARNRPTVSTVREDGTQDASSASCLPNRDPSANPPARMPDELRRELAEILADALVADFRARPCSQPVGELSGSTPGDTARGQAGRRRRRIPTRSEAAQKAP
jgi:hypothetical protein